jgi:4-amino-4-deoxy-L-arabinose transferase-like glycosyltransferase
MGLALTAREHRAFVALLVVIVGVRLATLGAYPLMDSTESRYAEIARKMLETGDWLLPQFDYGVPFWGKPPASTWLEAASMAALGVNGRGAAAVVPLLLCCGARRCAGGHARRPRLALRTLVLCRNRAGVHRSRCRDD